MNAITSNMVTPQTAPATPLVKPSQGDDAAQGSSFAAAMHSAQDGSTQTNAASATATHGVGHAHRAKGHGGGHGSGRTVAAAKQQATPAVATGKATAPQPKTKGANADDSTENLNEVSAEQASAEEQTNATNNSSTVAATAKAVVAPNIKAALKAAIVDVSNAAITAASADNGEGSKGIKAGPGATNKNAVAKTEAKHSKTQQETSVTQQAQATGDGSLVVTAIAPLNNVSARANATQQDAVGSASVPPKKDAHASAVQQVATASGNAAAIAPAQNEIHLGTTAQADEVLVGDVTATAPASADRAGSFAGKLDAATGGSVMVHGLSSESSTAGATFAYSLNSTASPHADNGSNVTTAASSTRAQSIDATGTPQYTPTPVRRLEIAVDDPLLGNVDVRAEMRSGAVHASVAGDGAAVAAAMPQLHQFLEQQKVTVHTLNYTSPNADVVRATSQSSGSMSFMQGGSQSAGQNAQDTPQRQTSRNTATERQTSFAPDSPGVDSSQSIQRHMKPGVTQLPAGSTLSIHI